MKPWKRDVYNFIENYIYIAYFNPFKPFSIVFIYIEFRAGTIKVA